MKIKTGLISTILVIIGLVGGPAVARAQSSEETIKELEAKIERLEAKITTLEQALAKATAAAPAPKVAAKRWTVAEIKAACTGKTTAEVKAALGPPDQVKNTLWGYTQLVIADPESGTEMNFLVLEFVAGKARISQLKKG